MVFLEMKDGACVTLQIDIIFAKDVNFLRSSWLNIK